MRKRKGTLEAHEQKRVSKDKEEFWEEFQVKRYKIHGNCYKSIWNKEKQNLNKTEKHRKTKEENSTKRRP